MEFRVDFTFRIFMDALYYAVNIAFYKVIFLHTGLLGGWDENQMMVFVGAYIVVDALHMTLFANNMWWLPVYINRGDLDYHLVRPVSSLFMLSVREFAANSFVNLLMAIGILIWAIARYPEALEPQKLLFFALLLINGTLLHYGMHILLIIPVFWTHSGRGFSGIFFLLGRFMERPDRIFTGFVRGLLLTALPFALMASWPAQMLMEETQPTMLVHLLIVTVMMFVAIVTIWRVALRAYSSASS